MNGIPWSHWEDIQDAHDRLGAKYDTACKERDVARADLDRLRADLRDYVTDLGSNPNAMIPIIDVILSLHRMMDKDQP